MSEEIKCKRCGARRHWFERLCCLPCKCRMACHKCGKTIGFFESMRNESFEGVFCDECLEESFDVQEKK